MKRWQKLAICIMLILLGILLMCGCNSIAKSRCITERIEKLSGEVVTTTTTEAYGRGSILPLTAPFSETTTTNASAKGSAAQNNAGTKLQFKAARPYHFIGIGCILLGAFCIWKRWTKTIAGLCIMGLGIGFSAVAFYLPQHEGKVFYGLIGVAIAGGLYISWRHGKDD